MKKILLTLIVLAGIIPAGLVIPWACSKNNNPISPAATATPVPTATTWANYTSTHTATPQTPTGTPTYTASSTPSSTPTVTSTGTLPPTSTATNTPTVTATPTVTSSPTNTTTVTDTNTPTNTSTSTFTFTPTNTFATAPPTLTGTPWTTGNYSPNGLAANAAGTTVYVAEQPEEGGTTTSGQVEIFNSSGVSQGTLTGVTFGQPYGTAVDGSGNIYVVDRGNSEVYIFNSSGTYQTTLTSWTAASGPTSFLNPEGIAVDSANLYVADTGNDEIEVFALGSFSSSVAEWGGTGSGAGTFNNPSAVAVDGAGNLYVADASNQLIQIFNILTPTTFSYSTEFSTPGSDIYGIAINGSSLYAADADNSNIGGQGQVEIYGLPGGNLLAAGPGTNAPNSPSPDGVILFGTDILVSDFSNNAIYKFQP